MFDGSSLTSLSSDASAEGHRVPVAGPSTTAHPTRYFDGPFASEPDVAAVKYLKDTGAEAWLERYDPTKNESARVLLKLLGVTVPTEIPEDHALKLLRKTMHRLRQSRDRLPQYNTVEDVVHLLKKSRRIMVLTGAGISVSCGIPDFRSSSGLYAKLQREGKYELDDPQQMFDIDYFKTYPEVFYSFASQIYPSNFIPSPCHRFVKLLESRGQLLRNYTQNIDNIESRVGLKKIFQCHGSFATASCIVCRNRVPGSAIEASIYSHTIPWCNLCTKRQNKLRPNNAGRKSAGGSTSSSSSKPQKKKRKSGWEDDDDVDNDRDAVRHIMKPDITFFGEALHSNFDELFVEDIKRADFDLLLIIGTSLKVAPVADIVYRVPHSIPQVLINKTPVVHGDPDVVLLGDADEIVQYLCNRLGKGWILPPPLAVPKVKEVKDQSLTAATAQMTIESDAPSPTGSSGSSGGNTSGSNSTATNSSMKTVKSNGKGKAKAAPAKRKSKVDELPGASSIQPTRIGASHVWMFPGAEPGPLLLQSSSTSSLSSLSSKSRAGGKSKAVNAKAIEKKLKKNQHTYLTSGSESSLTSLEDDVAPEYFGTSEDDTDPLRRTATHGSTTPLTSLSAPEERDGKRMRFR
ncbi:SIR2-domain-containing protein [Clavulina sp. PMI_390]|nr:SIR2-domain-containing protein [Clavulina sp. PMI_390]